MPNVPLFQLLTDRFALKGGGTAPCITDDRKYCGGSYQGIIDKLDYIQNLGFDAIWISPIVTNVEGVTVYGEAYHGYWAQDLYDLNPHFGSAEDLLSLSDALHQRDMYLMVDVVVNHFGPVNPSTSYGSFNPFNQASYFHPYCLITDYNNQTDVEQCWLGDSSVALADVNTENPSVPATLYTWIQSLVKTYNIDGLRIDTLKHIRKDFWPEFAASSGVYTVGEVYDGDTAYVKDYTCQCLVPPYHRRFPVDPPCRRYRWRVGLPHVVPAVPCIPDVKREPEHPRRGCRKSPTFIQDRVVWIWSFLRESRPAKVRFVDQRHRGECLSRLGNRSALADVNFRGSRMSSRSLSSTMESLSSTMVSDHCQLPFTSSHPTFLGQEQGYTGGGDPFNREA